MLTYIFLLLMGATCIVWTMGLILHGNFIVNNESWYLLHARRAALMLTALGMLWAARYTVETLQMPSLPDALIVGGIDLYLVFAIVSAHRTSRVRLQQGHA